MTHFAQLELLANKPHLKQEQEGQGDESRLFQQRCACYRGTIKVQMCQLKLCLDMDPLEANLRQPKGPQHGIKQDAGNIHTVQAALEVSLSRAGSCQRLLGTAGRTWVARGHQEPPGGFYSRT